MSGFWDFRNDNIIISKNQSVHCDFLSFIHKAKERVELNSFEYSFMHNLRYNKPLLSPLIKDNKFASILPLITIVKSEYKSVGYFCTHPMVWYRQFFFSISGINNLFYNLHEKIRGGILLNQIVYKKISLNYELCEIMGELLCERHRNYNNKY